MTASSPPLPRPRGFSLVEVVVGLLVLELGLLGVAALTVHALHRVREASFLSRAAAAAESVVDSLAVAGAGGGGERLLTGGRLTWTSEAGQGDELHRVIVTAVDREGRVRFRVSGLLPPGASPSDPGLGAEEG